ncbi:MAG: hypothetical protein ABWZ57_19370 [Mesorhizobium sp.]
MRRSAAIALSLAAALAVSACTSTEQTLDPNAISPSGQAAPDSAALAAAAAASRVEIAPIVGASVEAAAPLTERIAVRARERGLRLAGSGDGPSTHVLKGYFSAISEGRETIVIYVWDVLDPAGNRLHRIQGQEKAPARGAEGWASVTPAVMQRIGDQTVDQLLVWLAAKPG